MNQQSRPATGLRHSPTDEAFPRGLRACIKTKAETNCGFLMKFKVLPLILTLSLSVGTGIFYAPAGHAASTTVGSKLEAKQAGKKKGGSGSKVLQVKKSTDGALYEVKVLKKDGKVKIFRFKIKK